MQWQAEEKKETAESGGRAESLFELHDGLQPTGRPPML
jgi:hypothetical protein